MSSEGPFESLASFFKRLTTSAPPAYLQQQLIDAVCQLDLPAAQHCLSKGAQVNECKINGHSLLTYVILHDPSEKKPRLGQFSIASRPSQTRDLTFIKMLITAGANVNDKWHFDLSLLHYAVNAGWTALVELLIDSGATVDIDHCGHTPLWTAASLGYNDIVEILVNAKADINKAGKINLTRCESNQDRLFTPAEIALINGHPETVSLLCRLGAIVPDRSTLESDPYSASAPIVFSPESRRQVPTSKPIPIPDASSSNTYYSKP